MLSYEGTSGNIPLAAAFTMGPIVIMLAYPPLARNWEPSMRSKLRDTPPPLIALPGG